MCLNDSTKRHAYNFKDLTGQRFGRWLVISRAKDRGHHVYWLCQCDCGKQKEVYAGNLTRGLTGSCGCIISEVTTARNTTHGLRRTPEYRAWVKMIDRCQDENDKSYHNYGERGITVCQRWLDSFVNFYADMGQRPTPQHSIDRIDNNKGYSPDNCRWATKTIQSNNTRHNLYITHDDETHSLADWARITGIPYHTLYARIAIRKWPVSLAFNTPVKHASGIG